MHSGHRILPFLGNAARGTVIGSECPKRRLTRFWGMMVRFAVNRSVFIAWAIFLIVGIAVLDDYGVSWDEWTQREIAKSAAQYVLGNDYPAGHDHDRYYGVAFELPLLIVEQLVGLEDSRSILLSRHLLTHLFFLVGGLFFSLLVYRLFNNRLLALLALLLFLLHPRLYAHSFFNTKDLPFLSMFVISLYLIHRAFRRDTIWSFLLCGVGIGLLMNMRVLGVMLLGAVLAMRTCDLVFTTGREERRHVLLTAGVFALASVLILYVTWPLLWSNPLRFIEALVVMSSHPNSAIVPFQGEVHFGTDFPAYYIPTWIAVTTPPAVLLLGLVGAGSVLFCGLTHPGDILRNTRLRFGFLIVACLVLPVLAVIILNSNLYNGWRQMYFLYAPLCLLATFGMHWLVSTVNQPKVRAGAYMLAGISLAVVAVEMALVHPHQMLYFNFLVDRRTPEHLHTQYEMEYWGPSHRDALEHLLQRYPASSIYVRSSPEGHAERNRAILPKTDRQRIFIDDERVDFFVSTNLGYKGYPLVSPEPLSPTLYSRKVYNNSIFTVFNGEASPIGEEIYQEMYRETMLREPKVRSTFDVYAHENTLTYIKEPCGPVDTQGRFNLALSPTDPGDLPERRKIYGTNFQNLDFIHHGVHFDGKCLLRLKLPEYSIRGITTSQWTPSGGFLWRETFSLVDETGAEMYREQYRTVEMGEPVARSNFDVYLDGNTLIYTREPCSPEDTHGRFSFFVYPADADDLAEPQTGREYNEMNFDFVHFGALFDGKCLIQRPLPQYGITRIMVGQWIPGGPVLWQVEFPYSH